MKTLITGLLLPPGLTLVLLAIGIYMLRNKAKTAKFVLFIALVIGWTFSTTVFGRFISTGLAAQVQGPVIKDPKEVDLIVTLTAGMHYIDDLGWLPSRESYLRTALAYQVQEIVGSRTPVIISGGRTEGLRYPSEAKVAQHFFDNKKAQITPTEIEETSLNTYESALEVAHIVRTKNAKKMVLVTSEIHMLRALAAYRGRGLDPVPRMVPVIPRGALTLRDYLPSVEGLELNAKALYEILGIAEYIFSGQVKYEDIFYHNYKK